MESLHRVIEQARLKLTGAVFARVILKNLTILLLFLVGCVMAGIFFGIDLPLAYLVSLVLILFVLASLAEGLLRRPSRVRCALVLDRLMVNHELFTTALELESVSGDIAEEIRSRASSKATRCSVHSLLSISVHPLLTLVPTILAAALFVLMVEADRISPSVKIQKLAMGNVRRAAGVLETAGSDAARDIATDMKAALQDMEEGNTVSVGELLHKLDARLESVKTAINAARKLEGMGASGMEEAVRRGRTDAAVSAAALVEEGSIDHSIIAEMLDRLIGSAADPALKERLEALRGEGGLAELAKVLAEYAGQTPLPSLRAARSAFEGLGLAHRGQIGFTVPPSEVATGTPTPVNVDSVPRRHRKLVKDYFSTE